MEHTTGGPRLETNVRDIEPLAEVFDQHPLKGVFSIKRTEQPSLSFKDVHRSTQPLLAQQRTHNPGLIGKGTIDRLGRLSIVYHLHGSRGLHQGET